jgi:hypothetical protein
VGKKNKNRGEYEVNDAEAERHLEFVEETKESQ